MWFDFSFRKWVLTEGVNTAPLLAQFKKKFPTATDQEALDKINLAIAADPTPNKQYVGWIFRELINNRLRLPEDAPVTQQQLTLFNKSKTVLKGLGKELDINKYDRPTLWQTLAAIEGATSKRQEKAKIKQEGAEKLYEDGEWLVIKMLKPAACEYYARGTKWCTSDPETAAKYLAHGPLFMIYRNGQIYAQAHVESGQLMDPQDVEIPAGKVPEKLRDIIKNNVHQHDEGNEDFNGQRNKLFGIKDKVITYPDGHYWGTQDHKTFLLVDPSGGDEVEIRLYGDGFHVDLPQGKNLDALIDKGNWKDIVNGYTPPSNWNKYIIDFIIKNKSIKDINILYDKWNLGDLSKEERDHLFEARPDLAPKPYLKTTDGYLWCESGLGSYVLLDNWAPILVMQLSEGSTLSYGNWVSNKLSILTNSKLDKTKYSNATTEFILKTGIDHFPEGVSHYNGWKFKDLSPEDQAKVLKHKPDFMNDYVYHSKQSKDRKDLLKRMGSRSALYNMEPFGDDNVVLDDNSTLKSERLLSTRQMPEYIKNKNKIRELIKSKIPSGWDLDTAIKTKNIEKIKKDYPFFDTDLLKHVDNTRLFQAGNSMTNAVGDNVMEKVIDLIFSDIQHFSNDKFKIVKKDGKIYFIAPYKDVVDAYHQNKELNTLSKEYIPWYKSIEIPPEVLEKQIENIPVKMDNEKFLAGLKDYYRSKYDFTY